MAKKKRGWAMEEPIEVEVVHQMREDAKKEAGNLGDFPLPNFMAMEIKAKTHELSEKFVRDSNAYLSGLDPHHVFIRTYVVYGPAFEHSRFLDAGVYAREKICEMACCGIERRCN